MWEAMDNLATACMESYNNSCEAINYLTAQKEAKQLLEYNLQWQQLGKKQQAYIEELEADLMQAKDRGYAARNGRNARHFFMCRLMGEIEKMGEENSNRPPSEMRSEERKTLGKITETMKSIMREMEDLYPDACLWDAHDKGETFKLEPRRKPIPPRKLLPGNVRDIVRKSPLYEEEPPEETRQPIMF